MSAVAVMVPFLWTASYFPANGADAASDDYNASKSRVLRIASGLEKLAGQKATIILTTELKKEACVLPNGNIIISRGLIESCKSDDEVAFIIAHELSHAVSKDYSNSTTPSLAGPKDIPLSELREMNADRNAVFYLMRAGYNPDASIGILTRISRDPDPAFTKRLDALSYVLESLRK